MLKKSLAWVLALTLLLGCVSGLALVTSAEGSAFALASYISGTPLYQNASQGVFSAEVQSRPIAPRSAVYLPRQNNQVGMNIPASAGLGSNVTVEIKYQGTLSNQADTRLGMNYTSNSGQTDYGTLRLMGNMGMETLDVNEGTVQLEGNYSITDADENGWRVLTIPLANADYTQGGSFNLVKWSWDNGSTEDGWYIQYILLYNTDQGRPSEEELYIREETWGVIDFAGEEVEKELLSYTVDEYASIVEFDGMNALKIAGNDDFHLHMTADNVDQPAVKATDANVTVMLEVFVETTDWNTRFCMQTTDVFEYGRGHGDNAANGFAGYPFNPGAWYVMRFDITDNNKTTFDFGSWLGSSVIYIRKVVICRTELVSEFSDPDAFVDFENTYARYTDFPEVISDSYKMVWNVAELSEGDNYTIGEVEGTTAITAPSGYLYIDVDNNFTKNNGTDVADLGFTFTYLDKEGNLSFSYNNTDEGFHYLHIPMGNTGEWKTTTVYVSDAKLANAGNGKDMRINLGANTAISAVKVSIGADKAALNEAINTPVNTAVFTPESLAVYTAAKSAAQAVADNVYATKAQVENAITNLQNAIDNLERANDPRFTLKGASWDKEASNGEIVTFDGWNVFKFAPNNSSKIGIGDPDGILAESTSVTYEYEVYFDTTNGNDRVFLRFGDTNGWHGGESSTAPTYDDDGYWTEGQGYVLHNGWGPCPPSQEWGKISLVNYHYDPTKTDAGCITNLGSWVSNGDLYLRSIKVYDNDDPTKYILLQFNEDVNELFLTGGDADVKLVEKEGEQAWVIPSGWKALNIDLNQLLTDGTLQLDTTRFVVKINYWLEETTNNNELLMIKHYNPDGTGNNDNKTDVCEHQQNHGQLEKRNQWYQYKFVLDDGLFNAERKTLNITYGNGEFIYIRGVEVYAVDEDGVMTSEKVARWGVIVPDAVAEFDHPTYDWEIESGYQMRVSFSEGGTPTVIKEDNGRKCAFITDDFLYVNVDDSYITPDDHYVRIDVTHENGLTAHLQYNMILPEGADTSAEPGLSFYNFHGSHGLHEIVDGNNVNQGSFEFSDALGVIRPVNDTDNNWTTTSIYLSDASFRNAANGYDFRLKTAGISGISRIEVVKITEEEYNAAKAALADNSALKELIAQVDAQYPDPNDIPNDLWDVYDEAVSFVENFGYRATQEETDAIKAKLEAAMGGEDKTWGDADGDGDITSTDARLALQLAVNKIKAEDIANADALDVDGDGDITSTDARLILQRAVNKISAFPVETA